MTITIGRENVTSVTSAFLPQTACGKSLAESEAALVER